MNLSKSSNALTKSCHGKHSPPHTPTISYHRQSCSANYLVVKSAVHDMDQHVHLGGQLRPVILKVAVRHVNCMLRLAPHLLHEALVLILDSFYLYKRIHPSKLKRADDSFVQWSAVEIAQATLS